MAQWINVFWNNSFVNLTQLPLLCRNSRAVALAQPDLMAGWLIVVWLARPYFFLFYIWIGKKGSGEQPIQVLLQKSPLFGG